WTYGLEDPDSVATPKMKNATGTILRYIGHNESKIRDALMSDVDTRTDALKKQVADLSAQVTAIGTGDPAAIAAALGADQGFVDKLAAALGRDIAARMQQ